MSNQLLQGSYQSSPEQIIHNQNGSLILIVLMLMLFMSIIGIASTNTMIRESYIVRNSDIRKQNLYIEDSVCAEAIQEVIDAGLSGYIPINEIDPIDDPQVWINNAVTWDWTNWYNSQFIGRVLNTTNSKVPQSLTDNSGIGVASILEERGEWDPAHPSVAASPIRYALVGWNTVPGSSIKMTEVTRRSARLLTEYVSPDFGIMRLTVGLERDFY